MSHTLRERMPSTRAAWYAPGSLEQSRTTGAAGSITTRRVDRSASTTGSRWRTPATVMRMTSAPGSPITVTGRSMVVQP